MQLQAEDRPVYVLGMVKDSRDSLANMALMFPVVFMWAPIDDAIASLEAWGLRPAWVIPTRMGPLCLLRMNRPLDRHDDSVKNQVSFIHKKMRSLDSRVFSGTGRLCFGWVDPFCPPPGTVWAGEMVVGRHDPAAPTYSIDDIQSAFSGWSCTTTWVGKGTREEPEEPEEDASGDSTRGEVEPSDDTPRVVCGGKYWEFTFQGKPVQVKPLFGHRYLLHLLTHPGVDMSCLELVRRVRPGGKEMPEGSPLALVDPKTILRLKRKIGLLKPEERAATCRGDSEQASTLRALREALEKRLHRDTYDGKSRTFNDAREKARKNVFKAIKAALGKFVELHPELYSHLDKEVFTGHQCRYRWDNRAWTVVKNSE
ncbi:MAG: hypothetical protein JRI25_12215 [Deltaproteobacteria bacterium]|nr:hypothetical protein [Deltaproteobacteria bacterium]